MSTDYSATCDTCKVFWHIGQRMAMDVYSFGYGTGDTTGAAKAMEWIAKHSEHGEVKVMDTDLTPTDYKALIW